MGKQLYWKKKLPVLFLLPHLPKYSHDQYIRIEPCICSAQQGKVVSSGTNRSDGFDGNCGVARNSYLRIDGIPHGACVEGPNDE